MRKSTPPDTIERDGPIPLYEQIKNRLVAELRANPPGAKRIFSDAALMRRFGVSRMTVRNAVADLVREGVVQRIPGRGTFLVPEPVQVRLDGLERFIQEWEFPYPQAPVKVLTFKRTVVPPRVAERLHMAPGERALLVRRLREREGDAVVLDVRYVAPWCAEGITRDDVSKRSLFVTISEKSEIKAVSVQQEIGAEAAGADIARLLHIAPGAILLRREVTFFSGDQRPMLTGVSFYRADRFTFQMHATR
ncbi:MAG TPA: GntR family transcriptional regulator [Candidatus Dormibacteraeota bacterium]|nr:GntR family transcriptional regulator [Candidatus Dormibacteraeota bacterium]